MLSILLSNKVFQDSSTTGRGSEMWTMWKKSSLFVLSSLTRHSQKKFAQLQDFNQLYKDFKEKFD